VLYHCKPQQALVVSLDHDVLPVLLLASCYLKSMPSLWLLGVTFLQRVRPGFP